MLDLDAEAIYRQLARRAREHYGNKPINLVGVHTGGVWLAERLKKSRVSRRPSAFWTSRFIAMTLINRD